MTAIATTAFTCTINSANCTGTTHVAYRIDFAGHSHNACTNCAAGYLSITRNVPAGKTVNDVYPIRISADLTIHPTGTTGHTLRERVAARKYINLKATAKLPEGHFRTTLLKQTREINDFLTALSEQTRAMNAMLANL